MRDALYSCLIIEADKGTPQFWGLFNYGRAQQVVGSTIIAGPQHTNMPRAGYAGLPLGWEGRISHWRATTSLLHIVEPVIDWAAETDVEFRYGDRVVQRCPLIELLMAPQPLGEFHASRYMALNTTSLEGFYFLLQENVTFEVRVTPQRPQLVEDLQKFLITHTVHHRLMLWIRLEGEIDKAHL